MEKMKEIISNYGKSRSDLILVLQETQNEYNYLPEDALKYISQKMNIPLSRIYSLATFYSAFSLQPRGEHFITVCMGTACHVKGAPLLLEHIEDKLGIKAGMTTEDRMFTLETVNCLGACALAPILVVDDNYHGKATPGKIDKILEEYRDKE